VQEGTLVIDTRLRDTLRTLRLDGPTRRFALPAELAEPLSFDAPTLAEDAAYAVEAEALDEAYAVRVQRRLDGMEQRLDSLEPR
jgi:hypothetical protein